MERRTFLTTTAAATAASYSRILGANDRVNVGVIGPGGRGGSVWREFIRNDDVNPVAACDVYEPNLEKALSDSGNKAKAYRDFRKLLEHKPLDAVIVGTPDHWHAIQTVMACQAGLDVYVEKPMSLPVREGRLMVEAASKYKRVVQVGSQQRSGVHYREAVELIRSGGIGPVHHVEAGHEQNLMPGVSQEAKTPPQLPANFDYDMWLGPAPKVPYDPLRGIYHFRWFWNYSGGQMTNWGAHNIDVGRWALGVEAPRSVAGFGGRFAVKDGGETPDVQAVIYKLPAAVLTWDVRTMNGTRGAFLVFHGTKGTLDLGRNGYRITGEQWKKKPVMEDKEVRPEGAQSSLSVLHVRNFLDCMRTRAKPNADVKIGHATATMCHLGNIATRLSRSLNWDPETEQVLGDEEANRWLTRAYREPWKLDSV
jgi:myo-inositol 2-dehydrogenase / D-chiro-inositol 1-dehydrogenase